MAEPPNLFIVGAPKCGTTALYHYLSAHPDVFMSRVKEPHHFARTTPPSRYQDAARYRRLFRAAGGYAVRGDASPSYLHDPGAAQRIRTVCPKARIVALVRDPVVRAYSHYLMDLRDGRQDLTFMQALLHDERVGASVWGGASRLYVELGQYGEQLQRYVEAFGRERVLVLESEHLRRDRAATLSRVLEFLELPEFEMTADQRRVLGDLHNVNVVPTGPWSQFWGARTRLRERVTAATPRPLRPVARALMMRRRRAPRPPLDPEARLWLAHRLRPHVQQTEQVLARGLPTLHTSLDP